LNPGARLYSLFETRFWQDRLKSKDIGPILRDLYKQKKSEPFEETLLVPSSWKATVFKMNVGNTVLPEKVFSLKNFSFNDISEHMLDQRFDDVVNRDALAQLPYSEFCFKNYTKEIAAGVWARIHL